MPKVFWVALSVIALCLAALSGLALAASDEPIPNDTPLTEQVTNAAAEETPLVGVSAPVYSDAPILVAKGEAPSTEVRAVAEMTTSVMITNTMGTTVSGREDSIDSTMGADSPTSAPDGSHTFRLCGTDDDKPVAAEIERLIKGRQFSASLSATSDGCAELTITPSAERTPTMGSSTSRSSLSVSVNAGAKGTARRITVEIVSRNGEATVTIDAGPLPSQSRSGADLTQKWEEWRQELLDRYARQ